ncbi:alpha/beta hydrolase [Phormidesmis sp. 146-12]
MKVQRLWNYFWVVSISTATLSSSALAAEQVILKYGVLRESISVSELTAFADKGDVSPALQAHLRLSKQDPVVVRRSLTQTVTLNPTLLDRILNSPIGNRLLDPLSQAIRTPKGGADRQALRSALILSATGDSKLSILEVLQKYPTQEVMLDGDRLVDAYKRLSELADRLQNPLSSFF